MRGILLSAGLIVTSIFVPQSIGQVTLTPIAKIHTDEGWVAGKVLPSGVKAWLGVPFAKPPMNKLRWKPPQPISGKACGTRTARCRNACRFCVPITSTITSAKKRPAEDCLYLNVWAPGTATAESKLPVIIFIYGGGGTIGSAGSAMYDGEQMAKKGVVFVTMDYRLGILGFMAHPELTKEQGGHSGDYGLSRPERRAEMDSQQHRQVRRRSHACD